MAHLKKSIGYSSGILTDIGIDFTMLKELGLVKDTIPEKSRSDLINSLISGIISFAVLRGCDFKEEIAKGKAHRMDITGIINSKEISLENNLGESIIVFSKTKKISAEKNVIKVISQFPYSTVAILQEYFSNHQFIVEIDKEKEIKKKVVVIYESSGDTADEMKSGNYDMGVGIKFSDVNYNADGIYKVKETLDNSIAVIALKGTEGVERIAVNIKSGIDAKNKLTIKAQIGKNKKDEAEKIVAPAPIKYSNGEEGFVWIEADVPKKDIESIAKKLESIDATGISLAEIKASYVNI